MSNVKLDVVNELHKPARKNFERRRVIIKGWNDLFQADLVEMLPYSKINKGYRYILVVIDVFSKFVWAYPCKSKSAKDVTAAMKKVLCDRVPKNLQTDMGKEFFNKEFRTLMEKYSINHYSSFSIMKASIVERVNRTLKNLMWKEFSLQGNYKWMQLLPRIIEKYNHTKHSTIGMKPADVNVKNSKTLLNTVYTQLKAMDPRKAKLQIGDSVRISKQRQAFTKGYMPNWSNEIFKISNIKDSFPRVYYLIDVNNEEIQGGFYEEEIQKVKHPDIYLVEKIIKKRNTKLLVKWLGLDNRHNSWITSDSLV